MRRTSLMILLCVPCSYLSAASVKVYYDQSQWEQVLVPSSIADISFDSSQWTEAASSTSSTTQLVSSSTIAATNEMSVTAVSQVSKPGFATAPLGQPLNGDWVDNISKYGETTFYFGQQIYAFGGNFKIAGGNGLYFSVGGMVPYPYYTSPYLPIVNPYPSYTGFIGIVSDAPLSDLLISWGDNGSCHCLGNSYTLSQFEVSTEPDPPVSVAAVPEPNLTAFMALLFSFSVWGRRCLGQMSRLTPAA